MAICGKATIDGEDLKDFLKRKNMTTTFYKSDSLIKFIEKETGSKFNAAQRSSIQKEIRAFAIVVHREAVDQTIIAKNKSNYIEPNYHD